MTFSLSLSTFLKDSTSVGVCVTSILVGWVGVDRTLSMDTGDGAIRGVGEGAIRFVRRTPVDAGVRDVELRDTSMLAI